MTNIIDYVLWRGDLTIKENKINDIDLLIFSQIAMLDFDKTVPNVSSNDFITLEKAANKYLKNNENINLGLIIPNQIIDLLKLISKSKRYKNIKLSSYINIIDKKKEIQISALSFLINSKLMVSAFSGTDDTIIGWKENLNMIYKSPVPAQKEACKYIESVVEKLDRNIIIVGHSKGGNLALFSSIYVRKEVQEKILHAYNFDGPGFVETMTETNKLISKIGKVTTIIPQNSVVGRLFEHKEKSIIVKSKQIGLYQHDAFSWEVVGSSFVEEKEVTKDSKQIEARIKMIVQKMSEDEKSSFCENVYKVLSSSDSKNLLDIPKRWFYIWEAYIKLSKDDKKTIQQPVREFLKDRAVRKIIFQTIKNYRSFSSNKK